MLWYTKTMIFFLSFCQRAKSSSKVLFELDFFPMMTSTVVLNTQMHNIKLRSAEIIIKNEAQKQMVKSSFWM